MDFKVLITDSALADLREIVTFIAHDDPVAALRLGEKLIARALRLAANPERFALHDARRGIRKSPCLRISSSTPATRLPVSSTSCISGMVPAASPSFPASPSLVHASLCAI